MTRNALCRCQFPGFDVVLGFHVRGDQWGKQVKGTGTWLYYLCNFLAIYNYCKMKS